MQATRNIPRLNYIPIEVQEIYRFFPLTSETMTCTGSKEYISEHGSWTLVKPIMAVPIKSHAMINSEVHCKLWK